LVSSPGPTLPEAIVLVFLTSIRHPASSTDHRRVEELFETALRSLCAQDDDGFRVVVVCNAEPRVGVADPRVAYHVVDFPAPTGGRQATGRDAKARDKGTKLISGLLFSRRYRPDHVALVDADDLVSRRIAGFVNAHPRAAGWYVDAGYTFNHATWRLQRRHSLIRYCGSGLVASAPALVELSQAEANGLDESSTQDELLSGAAPSFLKHVLCDHTFTVQYLANHGVRLRPLPFRAIAWVQETGENYSRPKAAASGIPASPAFCREFGLNEPWPDAGHGQPLERLREALVCARSRVGALLDPVPGGS
jgi:hypothetical protein